MSFVIHNKGKDWEAIFKNKLWKNQQGALSVALDYLSAKRSEQAMVRMPTGTGKTGIIAILAQIHQSKQKCIIVAPFANLVRQLAHDVSEGFWEKIKQSSGITSKKCVVGKPSNFLSAIADMKDTGIIVCTYQTLAALQSDSKKYNKVRNWVDLILVDEGHREPAPLWSKAVRDLNKHIILFTATPYRNDLLYFRISDQHYYSYTFVEADDDCIVRNVNFIESVWQKNSPQGAASFLKSVLTETKRIDKKQGTDIKVIIRCETAENIEELVDRLVKNGQSAVGIHEQFSGKNKSNLKVQVPKNPRNTKIKYWVHQWKLLEGLDDDSFQLVARPYSKRFFVSDFPRGNFFAVGNF